MLQVLFALFQAGIKKGIVWLIAGYIIKFGLSIEAKLTKSEYKYTKEVKYDRSGPSITNVSQESRNRFTRKIE